MSCVPPTSQPAPGGTANAQLLTDARLAYHKLITGAQVASFRDSNGESVTYNNTNLDKLLTYIKSLEDADPGSCRWDAPMRFYF